VDIYALLCVAGLILANAFFSIGSLRLFTLVPDKVATAPVRLAKAWVYPAGVISALLSLVFGAAAFVFFILEIKKVYFH
jgi:hypothetical protein